MGEGIPIGGGFHSDVESSENEEDKTTQVEIKKSNFLIPALSLIISIDFITKISFITIEIN
jgi:hypothetical protein